MIDFYQEVLKHKKELLDDLKVLCEIPSVLDSTTAKENQPFGEANRKALDQMLAFGKRDGFSVDDCDGYAGAIDIGEGDEVFGILGHLDVVPVDPDGWHYPPFGCTLDGERLYGRGVADDKGPLLAAYYAAKIVNEMDFEKKYKTRIIFGCDEENGSSCVEYYFKHRPYPKMGFTPDAAFPVVYGEKAMTGIKISGDINSKEIVSIKGGTRSNIVPSSAVALINGSLEKYEESFHQFLNTHQLNGSITQDKYVRIEVFGKSAHGSRPHKGLNAIVMLCHYLNKVISNNVVDFVDHYFYKDSSGNALGIAFEGELGALTNNLGILTYENNHVEITLDIRFSYEIQPEKVVAKIDEKLNQYQLTETHSITNALYVDPKSELIQKLHQSYVEFTDDHEHGPQTMGGGTYAKEMPNCVAFGAEFPGRDNKMHENDETIILEELLLSSAIYAKALYDILKK